MAFPELVSKHFAMLYFYRYLTAPASLLVNACLVAPDIQLSKTSKTSKTSKKTQHCLYLSQNQFHSVAVVQNKTNVCKLRFFASLQKVDAGQEAKVKSGVTLLSAS